MSTGLDKLLVDVPVPSPDPDVSGVWKPWSDRGQRTTPQPTSRPDPVLFVRVSPVDLRPRPSSQSPRRRPPQSPGAAIDR